MIIDKNDTDKYAIEYLQKEFGNDFFFPYQLNNRRPPSNSLENYGAMLKICLWIEDNICGESMREAFCNVYSWRDNSFGGSFDVNYDYELDDPEDRLLVSGFILNGMCVHAEITDTETDEVVGYILINI